MPNLFSSLGALRLGLLIASLLDIAVPMLDGLVNHASLWSTASRDAGHVLIASAMAPILIVVLLFDLIMSRIRAADSEGAQSIRFRRIARIELAAIGLLLLYWVPMMLSLGRG